MKIGRIERDVKRVRKTAAAHDDHNEAMQMMTRFGDRLLNGADVGRRGSRNSLRMRMPITNKVRSPSMHFIDFPLFVASVGKIQIS